VQRVEGGWHDVLDFQQHDVCNSISYMPVVAGWGREGVE
jgi:hypothetical protein